MTFRHINGSDPNYTKLNRLGKGAFGSVYKVRRNSDGKVSSLVSPEYEPLRPDWAATRTPARHREMTNRTLTLWNHVRS